MQHLSSQSISASHHTLSFPSYKPSEWSTLEWECAWRTIFRLPAFLQYLWVVAQRPAPGPWSCFKLELTSPKYKSNKSHVFIGYWSPGQALCRRQHNHGRHADTRWLSDCSLQLFLASKAETRRTWPDAIDGGVLLTPLYTSRMVIVEWWRAMMKIMLGNESVYLVAMLITFPVTKQRSWFVFEVGNPCVWRDYSLVTCQIRSHEENENAAC